MNHAQEIKNKLNDKLNDVNMIKQHTIKMESSFVKSDVLTRKNSFDLLLTGSCPRMDLCEYHETGKRKDE